MLDLKPFHAFIKQHALLTPGENVLLAVSGGRDSVLMAHYFKQAGIPFAVAHCNFKLRGKEADDEELFTSELAYELEAPFFATSFDTRASAAEKGISIQMAARDLRYQWLEEIREDFGYHYIALAHHQNDAAETILLNLTRGTGIAGLHGILPRRGKLIRPLLFLNRDQIDEIVSAENLVYCDDSSNSSTKYARNKIRLQVIPVLKELNPKLEDTFKANARRFAELEILLNEKIRQLKKDLFEALPDDEIAIPVSELIKLNPLNTLIYGLFHDFNFTEPVLTDVISNLGSRSGKIFESATHRITTDRGRLILSRKQKPAPAAIFISADLDQFSWNGQIFKISTAPPQAFKNKTQNNIVQLDSNLLIFPLKLRSWQKGDYFYPLGMKGRKKLSDFFIEQKIPLQQKEKVAVLVNGNDDILWIAGYRPDERYKITDASEKIFILEKLIPNGKE